MLSTASCFVNASSFISKTQDRKLSLPINQKTAKVLTQLLVTELSSVLYLGLFYYYCIIKHDKYKKFVKEPGNCQI